MFLALAYTDDGTLAAAAPACDQQPYGPRYWRELHPQPVPHGLSVETAYADVADPEMLRRLLEMDFRDGAEAAAAIDRHLFGS